MIGKVVKVITAVAVCVAIAAAGAGCDNRPDGPPPGWVEVSCDPWPGGKGPCYEPPDAKEYTYDCGDVDGRIECRKVRREPRP